MVNSKNEKLFQNLSLEKKIMKELDGKHFGIHAIKTYEFEFPLKHGCEQQIQKQCPLCFTRVFIIH